MCVCVCVFRCRRQCRAFLRGLRLLVPVPYTTTPITTTTTANPKKALPSVLCNSSAYEYKIYLSWSLRDFMKYFLQINKRAHVPACNHYPAHRFQRLLCTCFPRRSCSCCLVRPWSYPAPRSYPIPTPMNMCLCTTYVYFGIWA